jgi:hypothetical protein
VNWDTFFKPREAPATPPEPPEAAAVAEPPAEACDDPLLRELLRASRLLQTFTDHSLPHLLSSEVEVWLFLFRWSVKGVTSTAQAEIVRKTGMSLTTVQGAMRRLKRLGLLVMIRRGNNLTEVPSMYRLCGRIREAEAATTPPAGPSPVSS